MTGVTYQHMAAYFGSVSNTGSNNDTPAVNDGILTISNTHFVLPVPGKVMAAMGLGANLNRLQLNTPSLRYVGLPSVEPINQSLTVPSPANYVDFTANPIPIPPIDEIAMMFTNGGAAAENETAGVIFSFQFKPVMPGAIYRLRGTATITGATGTWANGSITMDTTLPQGRYAMVGADVIGTNIAFARFIFPGAGWRPGVFARNALANILPRINIDRSLGVMGEFESINLPNLEILCTGANTAQTVYLDLIRLTDAQRAA